jgi:hypothetical protein
MTPNATRFTAPALLIALGLAVVPGLAPGLASAQAVTWTHTTTDPGLVSAMGALHDLTHGHSGSGPSARASQRGHNNAVGVHQTGGSQRTSVHQSGCNNTATSTQTAQNVVNTTIQHGCNNTHHAQQHQPNTATFTVQWGH